MTVFLLGAKRSPAGGENSTPEPQAAQAPQQTPAAFKVASKNLRDPTSLLSLQSTVSVPRPYRPRLVTEKMIAGARQQVVGDNRKLSHWRTERASLLLQVGNLDRKVKHWEGAVLRGGKEVVVLLKRKKFQEHELERAALAAEAARPPSPPRATPPATGHPHGSQAAAVVPAGTSTRQSSPHGPPMAASSPVRQRPTGTIPKHNTRTSNTFQTI